MSNRALLLRAASRVVLGDVVCAGRPELFCYVFLPCCPQRSCFRSLPLLVWPLPALRVATTRLGYSAILTAPKALKEGYEVRLGDNETGPSFTFHRSTGMDASMDT